MDQVKTVPQKVFQNFFDCLSAKEFKYKLNFEKTKEIEVFDFYSDFKMEVSPWEEIVSKYFQVVSGNKQFCDTSQFIFFSSFLEEYKKFTCNNGTQGHEDNLNLYEKAILTTAKTVAMTCTKR